MRRLHPIIVIAAVAVACHGRETRPGDTTGAASATPGRPEFRATLAGETDGMSTPQAVRYDAELDQYYVANVVGNPSVKDGQGFIAVVRADTVSISRRLVESGRHGAVLNAPKGLAITGDTLWVADIDVVRGFNRRTGDTVATIDLSGQGATYLSDVAVGPNGALYVTDAGIRFDASGAMSHPGRDRIFKIADRVASEVASGPSFASPRALVWQDDPGVWLIAPFDSPDVLAWREGEGAPASFAKGPGRYDGIAVTDDGRVYVSSRADGSVSVIYQGVLSRLIGSLASPAGLGVDVNRSIIAIPLQSAGKVVYYHAP